MRPPKTKGRLYIHPKGRARFSESEVYAIIRIARRIQPEKKTTIHSLGLVEVKR